MDTIGVMSNWDFVPRKINNKLICKQVRLQRIKLQLIKYLVYSNTVLS